MNPAEIKVKMDAAYAAGDYAKVQAYARDLKVAKTRDYFMRLLVLEDQGNAPSFTFEVLDWKDIQLFLQEQPTSEHNPGGDLFESILLDTKAAIEDKDSARLGANLLLIYKAIRRG